jgi:hypothetical protein
MTRRAQGFLIALSFSLAVFWLVIFATSNPGG